MADYSYKGYLIRTEAQKDWVAIITGEQRPRKSDHSKSDTARGRGCSDRARRLAWAVWVMARWRVDYTGKKLQHVGTVEGPNEREAIEEVVTLFRVQRALRNKLVATRIPEKGK
jgi:hypothetical protein